MDSASQQSAGHDYATIYEPSTQPQPNYGAPPPYQPSAPGQPQPQTRIYSTTNPAPIVTPQAQPNVVVVGPRPQYVVVDRHCIEEMQRRRRRRFLMMLIILLLLGPLLGAIVIIPIYT